MKTQKEETTIRSQSATNILRSAVVRASQSEAHLSRAMRLVPRHILQFHLIINAIINSTKKAT
jgi:hypothetical protein